MNNQSNCAVSVNKNSDDERLYKRGELNYETLKGTVLYLGFFHYD